MRDVVLDANVLVGLLDSNDSLHQRSTALCERLETRGDRPLILEFLLEEAVSVLCRRAAQRRTNPPVLANVRGVLTEWVEAGLVEMVPADAAPFSDLIDVVFASQGRLNCNDARLILLQRAGFIDQVATFDSELGSFEGFDAIG